MSAPPIVSAVVVIVATTLFWAVGLPMTMTPCLTVAIALSPTTTSVPAPAWIRSPSAPPITMSAPLPVVIVSGPPIAKEVESISPRAIGKAPNIAVADSA